MERVGDHCLYEIKEYPNDENKLVLGAMLFSNDCAHCFQIVFDKENEKAYVPLLVELLATAYPKK